MCRNLQIPQLYSNIALSQIKKLGKKKNCLERVELASHLKVTAATFQKT